jgi:hypothetical protein
LPHAKIIVTAENSAHALKMYAEGDDYVFLPRILAAQPLNSAISDLLNDKTKNKGRSVKLVCATG